MDDALETRVVEVVDASWDATGKLATFDLPSEHRGRLAGAPEAPDAIAATTALVFAGVGANLLQESIGSASMLVATLLAALVALPLRMVLARHSRRPEPQVLTPEAASIMDHGTRGLSLLESSDIDTQVRLDAVELVSEAVRLLATERTVAMKQEEVLYGHHSEGFTQASDRVRRALITPETLPGEPAPRWQALTGLRREAFLSLESTRLDLLREAARVCLTVEDLGEVESAARAARLLREQESRALDAARRHLESTTPIEPLDLGPLQERIAQRESMTAARRQLREDAPQLERATRTEAS